ncbi:uncharacterized protein BDR25DRAFT_288459 [Lindgomyces ingoldianus]|uniref:Uncharacterized protein n=1 Tax=Lindgomyces ingoldianus TaxID=673940 RepID=A0ACB6QTC7_9PLEO|nr:uncharacterized protein BDR25DRAFT_288459 [Lindgomyces ingoldianus]KAF2469557.1 hypothetical protein BDR25DRAFT_288459 [Lindgomyces ingoldianus]
MAPQKEVVLKLSSMRYKKSEVSEAQFHDHGSKFHAPKAAIVQARHGALRVAQYYTPKALRGLVEEKLPWAVRPGWKIDEHDAVIQVYVRTPEQMMAIVTDPDFQSLIADDDDIVDPSKATVTAGWEEVYVEDGKIVNIENGKSIYPSFAECEKLGAVGRATSISADMQRF